MFLVDDLKMIMNKVLPSSFDDSLSYYEAITKLKGVINDTLDEVKKLQDDETELTSKYTETVTKLTTLQTTIDNFVKGYTIGDGTVTLQKLANDVKDNIENLVVNEVHEVAKTVSFGLTDDGYFYVSYPSTWSEVNFSTDVNGNLVLEY